MAIKQQKLLFTALTLAAIGGCFLIFSLARPRLVSAPMVVQPPTTDHPEGPAAAANEAPPAVVAPEPAPLPPLQENAAPSPVYKLPPPLPDPLKRATKKPFGLEVSPTNSPVSPERFSGFHTGLDFETFPEEQDRDVPVAAICDGPLLVKRTASGYGGVAVQSCRLDGRDATVVYGHLRLTSINAKSGDRLAVGDRLGLLGRGFSPETDGERKHLHLGIHLGTGINIRGYVSRRSDLAQWLDPAVAGGWQ